MRSRVMMRAGMLYGKEAIVRLKSGDFFVGRPAGERHAEKGTRPTMDGARPKLINLLRFECDFGISFPRDCSFDEVREFEVQESRVASIDPLRHYDGPRHSELEALAKRLEQPRHFGAAMKKKDKKRATELAASFDGAALAELIELGASELACAALAASAQHGAPNLKAPDGTSLLVKAARFRRSSIAIVLAQGAGDDDASSEALADALLLAADHNDGELITALVAAGADPNGAAPSAREPWTVLHQATRNRAQAARRALCAGGAVVDARALTVASEFDTRALEELLDCVPEDERESAASLALHRILTELLAIGRTGVSPSARALARGGATASFEIDGITTGELTSRLGCHDLFPSNS